MSDPGKRKLRYQRSPLVGLLLPVLWSNTLETAVDSLIDAPQHGLQFADAGNCLKALWFQAVEADIDGVHP